jgi:hypothetical protein
MQSLLLFLFWVRSISVSLRITITLLVPLMVVEVVSHLPHSLRARSLVLYWNSCQTCSHVVLHVVSIQNSFVVIIYFNVFITGDTVVIVTSYCTFLSLPQFLQLLIKLCICLIIISLLLKLLFLIVLVLLLLLTLLLLILRRRRRRWFGSNFDVIWGKETFIFWLFDDMPKPPTILKGLFD